MVKPSRPPSTRRLVPQGLTDMWTSPPSRSPYRTVALPMAAEHLSGRRIQLGPTFNWRKFESYVQDMQWYVDNLGRFPKSFRRWLTSAESFTEPEDISLISPVLAEAPGLRVGLPDIAAILGEGPAPIVPRYLFRQRSHLYWYLCGVPLDVLANLGKTTREDAGLQVVEALRELFSRIGFMIYAYEVDVACIIGGDMDIPYLKRLLLAKGSIEKPLLKSNRTWEKYVQSMYHEDPSLLRQLAGTGPRRQTTSLFLVKPRRSLE